MSRFANAMMMTPVVIIGMMVCQLTIGRIIDEIAFGASAASYGEHVALFAGPVLDVFGIFHSSTLIIGVVWFVYCALAAISDAMYTRTDGGF